MSPMDWELRVARRAGRGLDARAFRLAGERDRPRRGHRAPPAEAALGQRALSRGERGPRRHGRRANRHRQSAVANDDDERGLSPTPRSRWRRRSRPRPPCRRRRLGVPARRRLRGGAGPGGPRRVDARREPSDADRRLLVARRRRPAARADGRRLASGAPAATARPRGASERVAGRAPTVWPSHSDCGPPSASSNPPWWTCRRWSAGCARP